MGVHTFPVKYSVPEDKEIAWAMRRLRLNCLGRPSEMQVEHLRQWLHEVTRYGAPDTTNRKKVVAIVQAEFRDGTLAEKRTWRKFVLITRGDSRDFWGIGLIEVIWKTFTRLLNRHFTVRITFHDVLHWFQVGYGTVTATLNSKMLQ